MRQLIVICLTTMLVFSATAQQSKKWQPFNQMTDIQLFAELNGQNYTLAEQQTYGIGLKGGVVWNPNNAVGFTFRSTVNKFSPSFEQDTAVFLKNVLTGLFYEYIWKPNNMFHATFPIAVGGGELYYDWRELGNVSAGSFPYAEQYYFFVEPGARLECNLTSRWKVFFGMTYIYAPLSFNYRGVNQTTVSRPTFETGVRFGRFFY